ncbi:hypothetical protein [Thiohalorhabdus methylotrophus]|uniref:Uncharacterized protein n=1 Tax=Thiohalorhabdus methylotrophus TaxID=3242694 RepID=A0ABV4TUQ3_9GAMM
MLSGHRTGRLFTHLACLVLGLFLVGAAQGAEEFSRANQLLFKTAHLDNLDTPETIVYSFSRQGSLEEDFSDEVRLDIAESSKGDGKRVEIQLFTGERERPFPASPNSDGNPALMAFLQRDVVEMEEQTDGSWRHFQKYIKLAFANSAEVKETRFDFNGQQVEGWRIRIQPYIEDPHRDKFEELAEKSYEFLLSPSVPGYIYKMRAFVPGKEQGGEPRLVETMQFQSRQ